METDNELDAWRRQWQSETVVRQDLARRVEHAMRMRRLGVAGACAVTVVFGLGVPGWALLSRRADVAVLAVAVWVFIVAAWMIARELDKALSEPVASTASAFLEFSIQWCERRRRGVTAASVLYGVMLVFNLGWLYQTQTAGLTLPAFLLSTHVLVVFAMTVLLGVAALLNRRRLARERENLERLRRDIEG